MIAHSLRLVALVVVLLNFANITERRFFLFHTTFSSLVQFSFFSSLLVMLPC